MLFAMFKLFYQVEIYLSEKVKSICLYSKKTHPLPPSLGKRRGVKVLPSLFEREGLG
jgi:hypothetical protein